ncbi:hypothetical protein HELRODRAFT_62778 [Helobdella robusta]|uniref:Membrane-associated tyrosine- and threonine-specific cdc2-inhibitory kinase n=1 Tax=Helobdella robusta TaxID=6412 RepID=T1FX52_HELRO|nr:hypothetical protein HELRODRAFT_62778 [Helobdella robusta]ESO12356.1 hypothetical protein HELRODRAFT_62778 [Helobdella robusta]
MDSPTYNTPRPTPKFFQEPQSFSTKKEKGQTPRVRIPPPPRPSAKKSATRLQFAKRNISKAMPVSFKSPDKTISTPLYNENKRESYFEQCFEIICKLGSGSFGDVYKVKSKEDGMYYAIKKSKERFKGSVDRKVKLEEVNKHEKLPVHRNCVKFIKAWEEKDHLYIQTELCKMSLSAYADEHHNIAEQLIMNYLIDLLMAVKHLHDHDLIHMDIKPENVFISDTDVCKLGDFGLVLDLNKREEWVDALEGDPKYLAPELMRGNFGKPADIFSLGITILELATDLDLPRGDKLWHQLRSGQLPDELLKGISLELKHLIEWMMQPDLNLRPTVDEVLGHRYLCEVCYLNVILTFLFYFEKFA